MCSKSLVLDIYWRAWEDPDPGQAVTVTTLRHLRAWPGGWFDVQILHMLDVDYIDCFPVTLAQCFLFLFRDLLGLGGPQGYFRLSGAFRIPQTVHQVLVDIMKRIPLLLDLLWGDRLLNLEEGYGGG